jgi:hypothetical protein
LDPSELPSLLMTALQYNDFPTVDAGLWSVWAFRGDTTKHVFKHNATNFIASAHNTVRDFNTSFYGVAMNGQSWEMESKLNFACWWQQRRELLLDCHPSYDHDISRWTVATMAIGNTKAA